MSSGVKQPVGQVRLTNIVFVRYDVNGQRFEIACFPNKVLDWRRKVYVYLVLCCDCPTLCPAVRPVIPCRLCPVILPSSVVAPPN